MSLVEIIEGIGTGIDAIGVAVIAGGAVLAVFMTIGRIRREDGGAYEFFRRRLGRAILLEMTGAWPWQQRSVAAADKSPARPTG